MLIKPPRTLEKRGKYLSSSSLDVARVPPTSEQKDGYGLEALAGFNPTPATSFLLNSWASDGGRWDLWFTLMTTELSQRKTLVQTLLLQPLHAGGWSLAAGLHTVLPPTTPSRLLGAVGSSEGCHPLSQISFKIIWLGYLIQVQSVQPSNVDEVQLCAPFSVYKKWRWQQLLTSQWCWRLEALNMTN